MKSFSRDTRAKLSHNPTGELIKILTPCIKKKIAGKLARLRATLAFVLILTSCSIDPLDQPPCETGDCDAFVLAPFQKDENGYYHATLDWTREYYPYFNMDIEATRTSRQYWYNDEPVVQAEFDTDTYFVLSDSVAFTIPLYRPYLGLWTYDGTPIPYENTTIYLSQFEGTIVPVVQNDTRIYFSDDEVGRFTTRRVVGPFPPTMIGDTITIFMKVKWDIGSEILSRENFVEKFIIK